MKGNWSKRLLAFSAACLAVTLPITIGATVAIAEDGSSIPINATYFPDEVFRELVRDEWDANHDEMLTQAECEAVTIVSFDGSRNNGSTISTLQGIEFAPNVTYLDVSNNTIASLDVSQNLKLRTLLVRANKQIQHLDVSNLTNLEWIDATKTDLAELDVSHNAKLSNLAISSNRLETIDVSQNHELEELSATVSKMTSFDASPNPKLKYLNLSNGILSSLNVSQNPDLEELSVQNNQLGTLDLSANINLEGINIENNNLTSLTLPENSPLEDMQISNNKLPSIDVTGLPDLQDLDVTNNVLGSLDVSKNPQLKELRVKNNGVGSLDVSHNPELQLLDVENNGLKSLDITSNTKLRALFAQINHLTALDLSHNETLSYLFVYNNDLTFLDFPQTHNVYEENMGLIHAIVMNNPLLGMSYVYEPYYFETGSINDESRAYQTSQRQLDLVKVAPQLDPAKISNVQGGKLIGSVLIAQTYPGTVTYQYDMGQGKKWDAKVKFTETYNAVFTDVTDATPHQEHIYWLADHKISEGYKNTDDWYRFEPMTDVYRQDMAAFLRRLAVKNKIGDAATWKPTAADWKRFTDVSKQTPHAEDILWLAHAGISTGYKNAHGSTRFEPMTVVYRQDAAAFLHRLAKCAGKDGGVTPKQFSDVTVKTPHADDIAWLGGTGISTGYDNKNGTWRFEGMTHTYRQDMSAFLHRIDDYINQ
ncbi:internalin [Bifidobacterium dolichotidis]|uniref:Internalin n=1 Tax=Bifidobacterium dolichotidis TaxID=2306976 RepID=A0A430FTG6_9BIFI|nr:S-layer homology domain-containing protein [Bifidobacterium dolichotidis]RSX56127.1 internalin [Bifidobacterium dolichotidis]